MSWWYLSFVRTSDEKFLGAGYSEGEDAAAAQRAATFAPAGADEILIIGPVSQEDMEDNVPVELRGVLIPSGHDHLDETQDTDDVVELARESGYQAHVHGPLE